MVMHCDDNNALGPDRFKSFFYKRFWEHIQGDIFRLLHYFYYLGNFLARLNTAFLILIPKLKAPVLPSINSNNQFGFIKGRNIQESNSIASKVIHLISRRKESAIIIKLYFQKACDSVCWTFLLETMRMMNFDSRWINWISNLLNLSQISVLVNGSPF
ncbi:uncharacterized protein LOC126657109 [Mercurialis annua]|uniref:uncharacterized protein LOC126657109 n=1 Tax=Mercurialis annua TaxID=3986 RepID=UPI002160A361|nr:uncharacterized protein LOC126657109 [Mercurialis annua]